MGSDCQYAFDGQGATRHHQLDRQWRISLIKKIISGGQSGADIAGIDAAMANNFPYGGWIPKDRRVEDSHLSEKYQLQKLPVSGYAEWTEQNVIDSDGTVIFVHGRLSGDSDLTRKLAEKHDRPWLHLNMKEHTIQEAVERLSEWCSENQIEILNVAGRSASKDPDIYIVTYKVVGGLLKKAE